MSDRRPRLPALLVTAAVLLAATVAFADVLVTTDEERLEDFAAVFDGTLDDRRLDEGLRYVDTDREEVEVILGRHPELFEAGETGDLRALVRDELGSFRGAELEVVQRTIELRGDEARVALRVRSGAYSLNATFDLAKHGDEWLVFRARLRT